jgi:hypothetical protein
VVKARAKKNVEDTYLPINLERLIWAAQRNERINPERSQSDLHPKEVSTRRLAGWRPHMEESHPRCLLPTYG